MQSTNRDPSGTSFFETTFRATVNDIIAICGQPAMEHNDGADKINFEWILETASRKLFTVYDWKLRRPIKKDEELEWHIGGHTKEATKEALAELQQALKNK